MKTRLSLILVTSVFCLFSCQPSSFLDHHAIKDDLLKKALTENIQVQEYNMSLKNKVLESAMSVKNEKPLSSSEIFLLPEETEQFSEKAKSLMELTVQIYSAIRDYYVGYTYFGGDLVFSESFSKAISSLSAPSSNISEKNYLDFILEELAFIKDAHFSINNKTLIIEDTRKSLFYCKESFYPYNDTWLVEWKGRQYKIISTKENDEVIKNLKPVITKDGSISWVILTYDDAVVNLEVLKSERSKPQKIGLDVYLLIEPVYDYQLFNGPFSWNIENKILVLNIPSCPDRRFDEWRSEKFFNLASIIAENDLNIIDLCQNSGGSSMDFHEWFSLFLPLPPLDKNYAVLHRHNNTLWNADVHDERLKKIENEIYRIDKVRSSKVFCILQTGNTASSGEDLLSRFLNVENTITIGTPTRGLLNFGNAEEIKVTSEVLNIKLYLPQTLFYSYLWSYEAIGIPPMLYIVDGGNIIEKAISFIKYYGGDRIREIYHDVLSNLCKSGK